METVKLSVKGLAVASAITWGATVLFVGLANMIWPEYGSAFLDFVSSVYPGYNAEGSFISVLIGAGYGLVDGAIGGAIIAFLYNRAGCCGVCSKSN